jgi:hypothetical protein
LIGISGAVFEQNHIDMAPWILKNMVPGLAWMSRINKGSVVLITRNVVFLVSAVLLFLAGTCVGEDIVYPTNLELIGKAVRQAADGMDVQPPAGSEPVLEIRAGEGEETAWLLESVLKDRLLAMGWRIKAQTAAVGDTVHNGDYILKLRIADLGLKYGRSWRRFLIGGKLVERIARASFYYELVQVAENRVLTSSEVSGEAVDVVPASMLDALSSSKYPFAYPKLEKGQWDRYLEGGLVIAIIGVLVYLFYSNKTAS